MGWLSAALDSHSTACAAADRQPLGRLLPAPAPLVALLTELRTSYLCTRLSLRPPQRSDRLRRSAPAPACTQPPASRGPSPRSPGTYQATRPPRGCLDPGSFGPAIGATHGVRRCAPPAALRRPGSSHAPTALSRSGRRPTVRAMASAASDWVKQDKRRMLHAVYRVGNMDVRAWGTWAECNCMPRARGRLVGAHTACMAAWRWQLPAGGLQLPSGQCLS